jgi:hypothetical protein
MISDELKKHAMEDLEKAKEELKYWQQAVHHYKEAIRYQKISTDYWQSIAEKQQIQNSEVLKTLKVLQDIIQGELPEEDMKASLTKMLDYWMNHAIELQNTINLYDAPAMSAEEIEEVAHAMIPDEIEAIGYQLKDLNTDWSTPERSSTPLTMNIDSATTLKEAFDC